MLDWIDFGPDLWWLTATVHSLAGFVWFCVLLGLPVLAIRLAVAARSNLVFLCKAPRITQEDLDDNGLYIGPLAKLQSDKGLRVEANLGLVTVNNNLWVEGKLEVCRGSHLNVVGTLFYNSSNSSGKDRITAADFRDNHWRSLQEDNPNAWVECGGLNGPGLAKHLGRPLPTRIPPQSDADIP